MIKTAHDNEVELTPEDVTVTRSAGDLAVSVAYTVPVDLTVTQLQLKFAASSSGKRY